MNKIDECRIELCYSTIDILKIIAVKSIEIDAIRRIINYSSYENTLLRQKLQVVLIIILIKEVERVVTINNYKDELDNL